MGITFIAAAFNSDLTQLSLTPPTNSQSNGELLILTIGLIGTTIVPYNIFLGSGISKGQTVPQMRVGLIVAILIGGLISIAIMIVGTNIASEAFSFEALAKALTNNSNRLGPFLLGIGLFAAGMSSSITSPYAAAITGKTLFQEPHSNKWSVRSSQFRMTWGIITLVGFLFLIIGIKPIPAIIAAQAINGLLLPIVTIFLIFAINDSSLLEKKHLNKPFSNIMMLGIIGLTCFLGLNSFTRAILRILGQPAINEFPMHIIWWINLGLLSATALIITIVGLSVYRMRQNAN